MNGSLSVGRSSDHAVCPWSPKSRSHRNPRSYDNDRPGIRIIAQHYRKFNNPIFASFPCGSSRIHLVWDNGGIYFVRSIASGFSSSLVYERNREIFSPSYHLFSRGRLFSHGTVDKIIRPGRRRRNCWSRLRRSATYASVFVIVNCRSCSLKFSIFRRTIRTNFRSAIIELSSELPSLRLRSHYDRRYNSEFASF